MPALHGTYFYADYNLGWVRSFVFDGGQVTAPRDWTEQLAHSSTPATVGEDDRGELYLVNHAEGELFRLVPE